MDKIRTLLSRIAALFRRQHLDADLEEELRTHIDHAIEENLKRGDSRSSRIPRSCVESNFRRSNARTENRLGALMKLTTIDQIRTLLSRCAALFRRRNLDAELDEELRTHLDLAMEENMRGGMSQQRARTAALRSFGGVTQTRETYRERRGIPMLEQLNRDILFGLRQLRRSPGFAITAILTLALGVGANTAIFTLIDSIILRPLPFAHQDRLASISAGREFASGSFPKGWIRALQQHSESFASISAYGLNTESNIAGADSSERVFGTRVTVNLFDTLQVHPELGRFFTAENAVTGQDYVVVLSHGYWRERFGGNPGVIGQTIRIDGISRRIIGVMPAGDQLPLCRHALRCASVVQGRRYQ